MLDLAWDYPVSGPLDEPSAEAVLREINGWGPDGRALSAYTELKDDGSTTCGCWIYCGCYADEMNQVARRKSRLEQSWVAPEWGWAWPANRRILYNRASADPDGRPWSERKRYVWWDTEHERWTGEDVPDFQPDKRPDYVPPDGAKAEDEIAGSHPFIMQADGRGWLFAPAGSSTARCRRTTSRTSRRSRTRSTRSRPIPLRQRFPRRRNRYNPSDGEPGAAEYPYVFTTYRLTEHHTAGGMSRTLAYLAELQPEMFCEVSPELAAERGLEHGGWATISTRRAAIEARVMVSERMRPLVVQGRTVHQIGLPYHWGERGLTTGDSANDLLSIVLDPNVHIQESKVATCDIRPGRRPRRRASGPDERERLMDLETSAPAGMSSYGEQSHERVGFFTDTSVCIGCKACEVACKEWNEVPEDGLSFTGDSFDNTGELGANTWRHVAFIEQTQALRVPADGEADQEQFRWLMSSDVCKHCTHAACLDVCPTGALFRTEFGTVVVQEDVCNGCGYCVPACPFGVIDRREIAGSHGEGAAQKCTLCYDRLKDGLTPACAKACPTESIQFGPLDELRQRADDRLAAVRDAGLAGARLYGETRMTASAGSARSSCCWTSPRCTACRRIRSRPRDAWQACGGAPRGPGFCSPHPCPRLHRRGR